MKVEIDIYDSRVLELLTCAIEGGSNYWCAIKTYKTNSQLIGQKQINVDGVMLSRCLALPFIPDCAVLFCDATGEDTGPDEPWVLDYPALQRGLRLLLMSRTKDGKIIPTRHTEAFLSENEDAETGDVFLQLCLFGEIVFG